MNFADNETRKSCDANIKSKVYTNKYISAHEVSIDMLKIAKVFMNGRSQAVRLPKEFRFETNEVYIRKEGKEIVISPKEPTWDEFFDSTSLFGDDFLSDRDDRAPQERELF